MEKNNKNMQSFQRYSLPDIDSLAYGLHKDQTQDWELEWHILFR